MAVQLAFFCLQLNTRDQPLVTVQNGFDVVHVVNGKTAKFLQSDQHA